MTASANSIYFQ